MQGQRESWRRPRSGGCAQALLLVDHACFPKAHAATLNMSCMSRKTCKPFHDKQVMHALSFAEASASKEVLEADTCFARMFRSMHLLLDEILDRALRLEPGACIWRARLTCIHGRMHACARRPAAT